jgi:hypothetical protein
MTPQEMIEAMEDIKLKELLLSEVTIHGVTDRLVEFVDKGEAELIKTNDGQYSYKALAS